MITTELSSAYMKQVQRKASPGRAGLVPPQEKSTPQGFAEGEQEPSLSPAQLGACPGGLPVSSCFELLDKGGGGGADGLRQAPH